MRRAASGPPRVLFVSHEALRTGAPKMLLHLIRWVRANTGIEPEILLLCGGPLESEFRALGRTRVLRPDDGSSFLHKLETGLESMGLARSAGRIRGIRYRVRLRRAKRVDLVYLNSVASFSLARYLPRGPRVVAHVHELDMGLRLGTPQSLAWPQLVDKVDLFIAAADCVAENLVANWGVPIERISTHHEFIDVAALASTTSRVSLPVPNGVSVVGGCGTLGWRKGADLFVQVAAAVCRRRSDVHFVWVGATPSPDLWSVEHEIRAANLSERVHLVDETPDAISYLSAFDVFALTSREDPFPLVALEASALGTPVVSFDNGGMRELITPSCGRLVPYLDIEAMADAIVELVDHPENRAVLGAAAAEIVTTRHDVAVGAPRLWAAASARPSPATLRAARPQRA